MRVTEKGQVTIPKNIREKLGVEPGSEVVFEEVDGVVQLRRVADDPNVRAAHELEKWIMQVQGMGNQDVSADDVMLATRGRRLDGSN